jgi:uncharacterized DUF497 family protein
LTYVHFVRTLWSWVSSGTRRAKPDDPYAITITDNESDPSEQRFVTLGVGAFGRLFVVAYMWRGENVRIISARPAEAHEREEYEAQQ